MMLTVLMMKMLTIINNESKKQRKLGETLGFGGWWGGALSLTKVSLLNIVHQSSSFLSFFLSSHPLFLVHRPVQSRLSFSIIPPSHSLLEQRRTTFFGLACLVVPSLLSFISCAFPVSLLYINIIQALVRRIRKLLHQQYHTHLHFLISLHPHSLLRRLYTPTLLTFATFATQPGRPSRSSTLDKLSSFHANRYKPNQIASDSSHSFHDHVLPIPTLTSPT